MSAELDYSKGQAAIAYLASEGKPWHCEGVAMPQDADQPAWLAASGLDFQIKRAAVRAIIDKPTSVAFAQGEPMNPDGFVTVPDKLVLYRADTNAPLSVVSRQYKVVQPPEILDFIFRVAELIGGKVSTAGALFGGARIWAQLTIPDGVVELAGGDIVQNKILVATSCDYSMPTTGRNTAVRVVCNNTVTAAGAYGGRNASFVLPHRSAFDAQAAIAAMDLQALKDAFGAFTVSAQTLAKCRVTSHNLAPVMHTILEPDEQKLEKQRNGDARMPTGFDRVMDLFNGAAQGADLPSARGTLWGALNAVTQYVDHESRAKSADTRFMSSQLGDGDVLKTRAQNALLHMATA